MDKLNKLWYYITLGLSVVVILQFAIIASPKKFNYENLEIQGNVPPCSKYCFIFSVRTMYTGLNFEVDDPLETYGGNMVAQICEATIESVSCKDMDISGLPDYKLLSRPNTTETFPSYTYLNKSVESHLNNKIYFLYRILQTELDRSKWVYDDPVAVISFNTETREVKKEGELSVSGLNIKEMYVSPNGSHLLIVDSSNPRYLPGETMSNIVLFDLKNKTTKTFSKVGSGGTLKFLTWINDNHFFYEEFKYDDSQPVVFRVGKIN